MLTWIVIVAVVLVALYVGLAGFLDFMKGFLEKRAAPQRIAELAREIVLAESPYDKANAYSSRAYYYSWTRKWHFKHGDPRRAVCLRMAIQDYTAAISTDSTDAHHYLGWRAKCYDDLGDFDLALADLNEYIRLKPDTWIHYERAWHHWSRSERYELCIADCTSGIEYSEGTYGMYRDCLELRAKAYREMRMFAEAAADEALLKSLK